MSHNATSFLNPAIPLPFCPGCGQDKVVRALDQALVATGLSEKEIVVVTDIGCSGLSDRHFTTHAFHGLHGRSITYATGIHLARPDLKVVVLIGDGGCGIGGAHLLNAARRNVGITVVVSNNFNFGMTGGEHSVTTPAGGVTSTTPGGNIEQPLDLCRVVEAAGGSFVARATAFDDDVDRLMRRALDHDGFAFVDVWNFCSAYFASRNRLTPKGLLKTLRDSGLGAGVLVEQQRPELAKAMEELQKLSTPERPGVEVAHESALASQMEIVVAGSAGQRIRSGAALVGEAALSCGLYATQKDDYPITVRTGHSLSEIILSPSEILYTGISVPDALVLLSEDGLAQVSGRLAAMGEGGLILADDRVRFDAPENVKVRTYPFRAQAAKLGKGSPSVIGLATLIGLRNPVPAEAFLMAASRHENAKIAESNRKAVEVGLALAKG